jgi:hypothetical protein
MKKVVSILILLSILFLAGCVKTDVVSRTEEWSRFVQVESNGSRWVIYDKYTKVMYVEKAHCITPLYNADGSLLLWEGE